MFLSNISVLEDYCFLKNQNPNIISVSPSISKILFKIAAWQANGYVSKCADSLQNCDEHIAATMCWVSRSVPLVTEIFTFTEWGLSWAFYITILRCYKMRSLSIFKICSLDSFVNMKKALKNIFLFCLQLFIMCNRYQLLFNLVLFKFWLFTNI